MAIIQFPGTDFHDLNLDWVLAQVKNLLTEWASTKQEWETLKGSNEAFVSFITAQWDDFKAYVENYLANLPLTEEVSAKINAMVEDGTLLELITHDDGEGSALSDVAAQWLAAHITQETGYVIDDTLTVQGAAADAKATGDKISNLNDQLLSVSNAVNLLGSVTTGYYINESGELTEFEYAAYTDFIPVTAGNKYRLQWTQITMRGQWNFRVHGYNSANAWVSQIYTKLEPQNEGTYTDDFNIPNGISYIRLSLYYYTDMSDIFIYNNTDSVGLTAYDMFARRQSAIVPQLTNVIGFNWIEGKYIFADGSITTANDRACTDFIPCSPFVSVKYVGENNHANVCGLAFYDSTYKFISGDRNSGNIGDETTVTSPANTAYLRLSTTLSMLNNSYVKFSGDNNSALMAVSKTANNISVYVDGTNGNDTTGAGTTTSPYKTIQYAINRGYNKIGILTSGTCVETVNADGKSLHLYAAKNTWSNNAPDRKRAKIDGNDTIETALTIKNAKNIVLEDVEVCNCTGDGCLIDNCGNVVLINCSFHDNGNNGIVLNYTNGVIRHCVAYNNTRDGFNMNYYGDTQFYDCSGWNNGDDGISHHQGCTGVINGGEWYGNTKGGVASPANGALVDILNIYSHNNSYGIWANADSGTEARTFCVFNSVLVNNSQYGITSLRNTAIMYNCKIEGNTAGQTSGNVTVL